MADTPDETTEQRFARWIDIDKPAPDIAAEAGARAQAEMAADAARHAGMTDAERLAEQQDLIGRATAPHEAESQADFATGVLGNLLGDVQAGRLSPEQAREALDAVVSTAGGLNGDGFTADLQERVDEARAQLSALRDEAPAADPREAGGQAMEFVGSAVGIAEPYIDHRAEVENALGDMAEAVLDARADADGADIAAIDAQRDRLDALRDSDDAAIEVQRQDYDAMQSKVEVYGDHVRDGTVHQGMSADEIEAVVGPEFHAIEADHAVEAAPEH